MKTAISLPDPLFKAGEKVAKKLGLSRSQLYARALRQFIESMGQETHDELIKEEAAAYGTRGREGAGRAAAEVLKRSAEYRLDRAIAEFYDRDAPPIDSAGLAAQLKVFDKGDW